MKFTLFTLIFTLFTLSISHVIPASIQLARAPPPAPAPITIAEGAPKFLAVEGEIEGRDGCGSSPYQQPCKDGSGVNLKIRSSKVIMGALGVVIAGMLL